MANYPNLSDSSCTSATERFRQATLVMRSNYWIKAITAEPKNNL